jgi:hypothetical protein
MSSLWPRQMEREAKALSHFSASLPEQFRKNHDACSSPRVLPTHLSLLSLPGLEPSTKSNPQVAFFPGPSVPFLGPGSVFPGSASA